MHDFTNKYAVLIIVSLPLLLIAIVGSITNYKTNRITKRRCIIDVVFWLLIGILLIFIEPIYNTLIRHNLTNSAPMSIFDVILLTIILLCMILIKQINVKLSQLNKKVSRMHENIVLAEESRHWDKR
jgi:hypothetical protein